MDIQYPLWLDIQIWAEFKKMRKTIKKPLTDFAEKLLLDDLDRLSAQGHDPSSVLKQSIKYSWQGLFPVKEVSTVDTSDFFKSFEEDK